MNVTITTWSGATEHGNAIGHWRTYASCQEPISKAVNLLAICWLVTRLRTAGLGPSRYSISRGRTIARFLALSLPPATTYPVVLLDAGRRRVHHVARSHAAAERGGVSTMFCTDDTDFSQYPPAPCGA